MSDQRDQFEQLGRLTAALCDDALTASEAAQLEQIVCGSSQASRWFIQYLQLHGELSWDLACAARHVPRFQPAMPRRTPASPQRAWIRVVLAASILMGLIGLAGVALYDRFWAGPTERQPLARLGRTFEIQWPDDSAPLADGAGLHACQTLKIQGGLAEIVFPSGAVLIVQGPALLRFEVPDSAFLQQGRLAAQVPPQARGFTVGTPDLTVIDQGTEFGLVVEPEGGSEVHTLAGSIRVEIPEASSPYATQVLTAGQALRTARAAGQRERRVEAMGADPERFVRAMPESGTGSVAAMRRLVSRHPHLIHHYTFEGTTPLERYRDRRGGLHLTEVVLCDGRGNGAFQSAVLGFDATTNAVAPYRAPVGGNTSGVALQSEATFQPPPELTIELLLRPRPPERASHAAICCALATRQDRRACSLYLGMDEHAALAQLMDAESPWVQTEGLFAFVPGHWYYVASTFRVESSQTRINTWIADLSQRETTLTWIVRNQWVPGVPAASRLGIGKGFDETGAHAYPWSGDLDEIAIYDAALDPHVLEQHMHAIFTSSAGLQQSERFLRTP